MELSRFITIYLIETSITIVLTFVAYRVLKRNPKSKFNQFFTFFVLSIVCSLLLNILYAGITEPSFEVFVSFLNLISYYFIYLSAGFMLLSFFLLAYPEKMMKVKNQVSFITIYGLLAMGIFFIPNGALVPISADGIQSSPIYSLNLLIFSLVFFTLALCISLAISFKLYKTFQDSLLRKKFKAFIIGIMILYYNPISIAIGNYITDPFWGMFLSLSMLFTFPGIYLIYKVLGAGEDAIKDDND